MSIVTTEGIKLSAAEVEAYSTSASNEEMARYYAEMLEDIHLHIDDLNESECPPDRRIYRNGKEAWVYEHGNVADLLFVVRD